MVIALLPTLNKVAKAVFLCLIAIAKMAAVGWTRLGRSSTDTFLFSQALIDSYLKRKEGVGWEVLSTPNPQQICEKVGVGGKYGKGE